MGILIALVITAASVIFGVEFFSDAALSSVATVSDAWKGGGVRDGEIAVTDLEILEIDESNPPYVDVRLRNSGSLPIEDFSRWDVLARYFDTTGNLYSRDLGYTTALPPGDNEWTVEGIYAPRQPIRYDSATAATPAGARTSLAFTHTVGSQSNRLLLVGTSAEDASAVDCAVASVTSNGAPLTKVGEVSAGTGPYQCASLWYLLAPPAGANSVTVTFTGTVDEASAGAVSLYDVRQQAPEASATQGLNAAASITTTVTTLTEDAWVVDVVGSGEPTAFTPGGSQVERYDAANASSTIADSTLAAGAPGAKDVSWTPGVSGDLAHVVAAFAPLAQATEHFEPGVFNPGEELVLRLKLAPAHDTTTCRTFAISVPNGVTVSKLISTATCPNPPPQYFLHNNPTPPTGDTASQHPLPMDGASPSATVLYNYDTDRDSAPGLRIRKSNLGLLEVQGTKYQEWRTGPLTRPLKLQGTVTVDLWSAMDSFATNKRGVVTVYLRHLTAGLLYLEIGSATIDSTPWDTQATGTWVKKTFTFSGLDYTVPAGDELEVRVMVDQNTGDPHMWFAYDTTAYPTVVRLP